jgi:hypothetical protein
MRDTCSKCCRTDDATRLFTRCQRTDCPYKHLAKPVDPGFQTRAGKLARLRLILADMAHFYDPDPDPELIRKRAMMAQDLLQEIEEVKHVITAEVRVDHPALVRIVRREVMDDPRVDLPTRDAMRRNPEKIEVTFGMEGNRVTARVKFEEG